MSTRNSGIKKLINSKSQTKKQTTRNFNQKKTTSSSKIKQGLLYRPKVKKPPAKLLSQSTKLEKSRKQALKTRLKNTFSEKMKNKNKTLKTSTMYSPTTHTTDCNKLQSSALSHSAIVSSNSMSPTSSAAMNGCPDLARPTC